MSTGCRSRLASRRRESCAPHLLEKRILKEQIVIRVGGNAELWKERKRRLRVMCLAGETQTLVGIRFWFRDLDPGHADRDAREAMAVDVVEHAATTLYAIGFACGALVASGGLSDAHEGRAPVNQSSIHGGWRRPSSPQIARTRGWYPAR